MKNENIFEKDYYEMNGIESVQTFTETITIKATERIDDFMFEVMQPYCEKVSKQFITKKDLENALTQYFNRGEWIEETIALPLSDSSKECVRCSKCGLHFDYKTNFCSNCGDDKRGEINEHIN